MTKTAFKQQTTPPPAANVIAFSANPTIERNRVLGTEQAATFIGLSVPHFRRLYRLGKVPKGILIGERKLGWRMGTLIDWLDTRDLKEAA